MRVRATFHATVDLLKKWREFLFPETLPVVSPYAQSVDWDDVTLAARWLAGTSRWFDSSTVENYETKFAHWNGSGHAFAFMGGRMALSACIEALGLKTGDEVIVPAYTCVVVPNAFKNAGIEVVYCDIELESYGPDLLDLSSKVTAKTRGIVIQHLYGLVCRDYEAILAFAKGRDIRVIEDCAHAAGAVFKGVKVGNRGDVAIYSSNRSKIFSTVEGGVAVTNDEEIAARLRACRDRAVYPALELVDKLLFNVILDYFSFKHPKRELLKEWIYGIYGDKHHYSTTFEEREGKTPTQYRMPAPLAALGMNQLGKIDRYNDLRRRTAATWDNWCEVHGYRKPEPVRDSVPVYLRYPVLVEPEKKLDPGWAARELGVELGVWFVSNLHPADVTIADCPNAARAVKECVNLPGICL